MAATEASTRRVATYARVSSEDQADRGTIATQRDELERRIAATSDITVLARYEDDGVSGTVPLAERPDGRRLMADAAAGRFEELWVYKVDRLGRDAVDLLVLRRLLDSLGIRLVSLVEGEPDLLGYDVQAVVADHYRREFLRRSADGTNRAAREGRYMGGIVAYGYRVEGEKGKARLVPDEAVVCAGMTAVDVVRLMYERVALNDRSCREVADELNALGVLPRYARDGRGVRGRRTQERWSEGRIRNMLVEPIYRGEQVFGRRSRRPRELITAPVEPLVSVGLWEAAQAALARHRIAPRHTARHYLLSGVMTCALCGLTYVASTNKRATWYRCGGKRRERGPSEGRCQSRDIKGDLIEPLVWQDVERFLRSPGDLLDELQSRDQRDDAAAGREQGFEALSARLADLDAQRRRAQGLAVRGAMSDVELDAELARIEADRAAVERHRASLAPIESDEPPVDADLLDELRSRLDELRSRLDAGLGDVQRQEIVRLLVGPISITTTIDEEGNKEAAAVISYRFPGALSTRTGTREGLDYSNVQRIVQLPPGGRWPRKAVA
jgi:site-specific DNA recombinase